MDTSTGTVPAATPTGTGAPVPVREVGDVETLKVLSDPLRLAILRVLMRDAGHRPRVMTVKEIADALGEPPTKLYRHVKQLEARDLVQAAATRLVSGIVETSYRAGQHSLTIQAGLLNETGRTGEAAAMMSAGLAEFRSEFLGAIASGAIQFGEGGTADPYPHEQRYRRPVVTLAEARLSVDRANELRDRLAAIVAEYFDGVDDPGGVPVRLLAALYSLGD